IVVFADAREQTNDVIEIIRAHGAIVTVKTLDVGDFICSDRVVIERKTTDDFIQSVIDGRLFEQLDAMSKNFERPVLIVEGENVFENMERNGRRMHPNAIRGVFASIVCDYKVPIVWTSSPEETAAQIFWIAKREQAGEKRELRIRGKRKRASSDEEQEFIVAGLPKISNIIAKRLLKHFKTPEKIFAASEEELQDVDGIGKVVAKKIKNLLTKKYGDGK
ncbi:MAG: ERCC4 domain-containing protein, partial [Candidatus Aenigmatarchaeota archaeon]